MKSAASLKQRSELAPYLAAAGQRILDIQSDAGAIAWFEDGPWDSWNHTESAMALAVLDEKDAALKAYRFLQTTQLETGAWHSQYGNAIGVDETTYRMCREPAPDFQDTNFTAYCAVGIWHAVMRWNEPQIARDFWPMVSRAIEFVLSLQSEDGDITWSLEALIDGETKNDSVLAGNASIYKSLHCAILLGDLIGENVSHWRQARSRLGDAIKRKPDRFDRNGTDRSVFAMDWYYPVLAGTLRGDVARERLNMGWDTFVEPGLGCRCVSSEPWVTVAEASELVMALVSVGEHKRAAQLLNDQIEHTDEAGAAWMGWQFTEKVFWHAEQPSWTQGAFILAVDALYDISPASRVLTHHEDQSFRSTLKLLQTSTSS